jgi:chromate reductase
MTSNTAKPRILAFAGSARKLSFNRMLVAIAADQARAAGADVTLVDLKDFPMPIYDGDEEAISGVPAKALELRALIAASHGLLVATPEYNGSVTALLKNTLDWCSRPTGGQDGLAPFRGKTAVLLSASVSPFGGMRSAAHLRAIFSKMGVNVLADEVLVPLAPTSFSADGKLTHELANKLTAQLASNLVSLLQKTIPA